MSTWVALEPLSVTVEAGGEAEASLRIRNTSDIVEEYHVDVVGDPAMWCTAEPATLRLYPGTTGTVRLTFAPPKGPDPAAGPHPYGVRVRPVEAPDAVTVPEGSVVVAPFTDIRTELLPMVVRGWSRAKPWLVVDNYGNTPATLSMQAAVQDQSVDFDTRTPSFQVPPGRAHFGSFTGRPHRLLWAGHNVRHPYTANVIPSGSPAINTNGTYLQTALIPTWLSRLLALLIALAIAFIALWMLAKPTLQTQLKPKGLAMAPAGNASTAVAAPSSAPLQSSTPATQPAAAPPPPPAGGGGGGGGGGGAGAPRPIGFWPLTDGANGAAPSAKDTAGSHPLAGQNTMWCQNGGCGWFNDGQNAAFTSSGPVVNTGPGQSFTVSAYVYIDNLPTGGASDTAVAQDGGSKGNSAFYLQYLGTKGCWSFSRETDQVLGCTGNYAQHWTHLTGVYNGSNGQTQLYVNGQLAGSGTDTAPAASGGPLTVGRAMFGGKQVDWWGGGIKNVEVFGQALSASQVRTVFQQNAH